MQNKFGNKCTFIKFFFEMQIFQGNHKGSSASGLAEIARSGLKN
jgi:hypothetical protein